MGHWRAGRLAAVCGVVAIGFLAGCDQKPSTKSDGGGSREGSAVSAATKIKSTQIMVQLVRGQYIAANENKGKWPDKLPEGTSLANPWTGSDPGYEYVPPPKGPIADAAKVVVLYQLKDGKRLTDAATGRADGSVREANE